MSYSVDFRKRRLFSPLSTISPSQANVTSTKRAATNIWSTKDTFKDQTSLDEKENIEQVQEKVTLGEYKFQSLNNCSHENISSPKTQIDAKKETETKLQTKVYPLLISNIFQRQECFPSSTADQSLSLYTSEYTEKFKLQTVKLVREAQDFIQNSKCAIFGRDLLWLPFFQTQSSFRDPPQTVNILDNIYSGYITPEPGKEREQQNCLFEQILDRLSATNKLLESQVENEESIKTKIHICKSSHCASTNTVTSIDSTSSQLLDNDLEEELFYSIERFQIENQKLRFEIEQLEQELQEIHYLREIESLAADATISEKNEELSRLRGNYTLKSSMSGDSVGCDSIYYKTFVSKNQFGNVDCFESPKVTKKFSSEAGQTPGTIVDTRRRLRACIDYLLEERNETTRFEYVERATYEDRLNQLQNKISAYDANLKNLSSCLEEQRLELKAVQAEKSQFSEVIEEKTQQLLSSSLQLETAEDEIKQRNREIESLKAQVSQTSTARTELSDSLQRVSEEVLQMREKMKLLQERLDETKAKLCEKDAELESFKKEVAKKDEQLVSNYSLLSELRSKLLKTENDLEQATETAKWQETQYQSQIISLTEELRICEDCLEAVKSEKKKLLAAVENEKSEKATLVSEMNKLVEETQRLSHQLTYVHESDEKERELAESRKRLANLENELRKKEFDYSILQNDYAELHMKLEIEKDRAHVFDEEAFSAEQRRRQDAERESAELKDELRKLTQFIKKYRDKTESKMSNLKMIICQRDTAVEELKNVHQLLRSSEWNAELRERIVQEIVHFFSQLGQQKEGCYVSMH
ncbi:hypothetical protein Gasu2_13580 [Galdieria sulphuraria]|uniref:Uncharacterized protein n=1 Tax=Galdieria sulphuraria TaxID=130081 RepID=M2XZF6_GALSU|nr:uncharacterized protein Gasu_36020 [Galdieria sulphuraria]EME29033.1 hypothetical protein Gasu_36020 [Galdieria sulphuraria]GJD06974.1 hypothetical protein Gasu2_13580 [Galdieria sulphuraria]|eukprot:XP_005705553.1 hypothetical protein Gasu_36020 [Galdieria sulphuraria]